MNLQENINKIHKMMGLNESEKDSMNQVIDFYISNKLGQMRMTKNDDNDISFQPKEIEDPAYGVDLEWIPEEESYVVLVGHLLWQEVERMFDLNKKQLKNVFAKSLNKKGIQNIKSINSIDFGFMKNLMDQN